MGDFTKQNVQAKSANYSGSTQPFECDYCMHGGKCKISGYSTGIHCLCLNGFEGDRCQFQEFDFTHGLKKDLATPGVITGIVVGVSLLVIIIVIGLLIWRNIRSKNKKAGKNDDKRMKKVSIEGISIIGDKQTANFPSKPVCIVIKEEKSGNEYVTLPIEDNGTSRLVNYSKLNEGCIKDNGDNNFSSLAC